METNLLDRMLSSYKTDRSLVTVTLQNKIRITGRIKAFDSYVIVLEGPKGEILYRHAVSSVCPAQEALISPQAPARPAQQTAKPPQPKDTAGPARPPARKPRPQQQPTPPATTDQQINNSMQEGLRRWMQEQKAAK